MTRREEGIKTAPKTKDSPKTRLQTIEDTGAIVVTLAKLGNKRTQQRKKDAEKPLYIIRI